MKKFEQMFEAAGKACVRLLLAAALACMMVPAAAFAQLAPADDDEIDIAEYCVVTGVSEEGYNCTGTYVEPTVEVSIEGEYLARGSEYTVSYKDNVEPGTAYVIVDAVEGSGFCGTITVTFTILDTVVFTVYDVELDDEGNQGEMVPVAEFYYSDMLDMAAENEGYHACVWNHTKVQASNDYVTFDQLISTSYSSNSELADPWTSANDTSRVFVNYFASDGSPLSNKGGLEYLSKETIESTYSTFYPDALYDSVNDISYSTSMEGVDMAPAILLSYVSETLSSYSGAAAAAEVAASKASTNRIFRASFGTSVADASTGELNIVRGWMLCTGPYYLCVYHYASDDIAGGGSDGEDELFDEDGNIKLSACSVSYSESWDCTGAAIEPVVSVTLGDEELSNGTEYTVSYEDNVAPGTGHIIVSAVEGSGFAGSLTADFTINDSVVFSVYDVELAADGTEGEQTLVKEFYYADMLKLAEANSSPLYATYTLMHGGTSKVQASSSYVTFDQLAEAAYAGSTLTNYWSAAADTSQVYANVLAPDGFSWDTQGTGKVSKAALTSTYGYYYSDATSNVSDSSYYLNSASGAAGTGGVVCPASIMLSYSDVAMSSTVSCEEAAAAALAGEDWCFRVSVGTSVVNEAGDLYATYGHMMATSVNQLCFYHEAGAALASEEDAEAGSGSGEDLGAGSGSVKLSAQTITVSKKSASFKKKAVKKAAKTFSLGVKAKGSVACTKVSGSKKLSVSRAGKVKIKKGTAKGTYTMRVKIRAAATSKYAAATKTIKVTVKVK